MTIFQMIQRSRVPLSVESCVVRRCGRERGTKLLRKTGQIVSRTESNRLLRSTNAIIEQAIVGQKSGAPALTMES